MYGQKLDLKEGYHATQDLSPDQTQVFSANFAYEPVIIYALDDRLLSTRPSPPTKLRAIEASNTFSSARISTVF